MPTAKPTAAERLIVALDVPTVEEAAALVARIGPAVSVYKIGLELLFAGGGAFAQRLASEGRRVFLDAKLLDIGNTVERAVAGIARLGVSFLTVHGHDRKTLDAAVSGRGASGLKLLSVTVLTNLTAADLTEQGIGEDLVALVLRRAKLAAEAGVDGVVASAREAGAVRDACGPDLLVVTPGIRPAGADIGDQSRTATPAAAIAAGADYLVVGRPITRARDPRAAAEAVVAEIASSKQR